MLGLPLEQFHKWKEAWGDLAPDGTFTLNPRVRWELQPETGLYHLFWDSNYKACWGLTNHGSLQHAAINPAQPNMRRLWLPTS